MMKISKMAMSIEQSLTRKLFDKAKQYQNVIDFTLGDPDFQTPECVKAAGCEAIMAGKTKYSANAGLLELRQAISDRIFLETSIRYKADGEIMVSVGAMEALYLSLSCLINPGDEVLIPAPYWINYRHMVQMCGGIPVLVDTDPDRNFMPDVKKLERVTTEKTVAIIVNSPNNPTGAVYDRATVEQLCSFVKKHDLAFLWDECYKTILYDDKKFVSPLECNEMKDKLVMINSCSKAYSMTGWRLGYAAAPEELIRQMTKLQENIAACASLPSQYAAIAAFSNECPEVSAMLEGFDRRRKIIVEGLNAIPKLNCRMPEGTFYAFADIRATGIKSEEFSYQLLDDQQVAVVPGVTYGDCCEGFIRLAYTMDEAKIREGIDRIGRFIAKLR